MILLLDILLYLIPSPLRLSRPICILRTIYTYIYCFLFHHNTSYGYTACITRTGKPDVGALCSAIANFVHSFCLYDRSVLILYDFAS